MAELEPWMKHDEQQYVQESLKQFGIDLITFIFMLFLCLIRIMGSQRGYHECSFFSKSQSASAAMNFEGTITRRSSSEVIPSEWLARVCSIEISIFFRPLLHTSNDAYRVLSTEG